MNQFEEKFYDLFLSSKRKQIESNNLIINKKDIIFSEEYTKYNTDIKEDIEIIIEEYQIEINNEYYLIIYKNAEMPYDSEENLFYAKKLKQIIESIDYEKIFNEMVIDSLNRIQTTNTK